MTTAPVDEGWGAVPARLDAALVAVRSAVAALEPWTVPTRRLADVLVDLEGVVRAAQAAQVAVVGEVAARGELLVAPGTGPATAALRARGRSADGRLALAGVLGVHPATAARRQATVAFVTGSGLPPGRAARAGGGGAGLGEGAATGRALAEGRISAEATDVVAATVLELPEHYGRAGRAAVEETLLAHAPEVALTTLRHRARGLLARAEVEDPEVLGGGDGGTAPHEGDDLLGRAEERSHRRRELHCSPDLHGTWHVRGRLAPEAGATVVAALEALAAPEASAADGPDLRSAAQRRADALLALADRALAAPPGSAAGVPGEGGARARVVVTTDLAVLRGAVRGAGLLADDAPLSAGAVRRLACDAELVPAVLGTASEPLDVGRSAYVVSPAQRRALALRDRGCRAPGCGAPPSRTHAHHVRPWVDGGTTDLGNLVLLCGHDHRRVHRGELDVHVVDGRPVVVRAGEGPPVEAPPPWRARLEVVRHRLEEACRRPAAEPGRACPPSSGAVVTARGVPEHRRGPEGADARRSPARSRGRPRAGRPRAGPGSGPPPDDGEPSSRPGR